MRRTHSASTSCRETRRGFTLVEPPAVSRRGRAAFTLVELLVVIGIIALLISILMPALRKAREHAVRTQCLANIRSVAQAINIYAAQSKGTLPASVYPDGQWSYAFDLKNSMDPARGPMGLGLLLHLRILDVGTAARILHDDSMDTTGNGLLPQGGHSMDVPPGTNMWGSGVSWFETTTTQRIIYAYNYRGTSYYNANNRAQLKLGRVKNDTLVLMCMPDPRFGKKWVHKTGYNFVRIDGSGQWLDDRQNRVEELAGWSLPVDGMYNSVSDERLYRYVETGIWPPPP